MHTFWCDCRAPFNCTFEVVQLEQHELVELQKKSKKEFCEQISEDEPP